MLEFKDFLHYKIINNDYYNNIIKNDEEMKKFLHNEPKEIIKYYPNREYKV
jgi:hypothetical protein